MKNNTYITVSLIETHCYCYLLYNCYITLLLCYLALVIDYLMEEKKSEDFNSVITAGMAFDRVRGDLILIGTLSLDRRGSITLDLPELIGGT